MNAGMSQLLSRLNVSVGATDSFHGPKLAFIDVGGSLLLKREFQRSKSVTIDDFPDRTGFEAFINHVHLPFNETSESLRACIRYATQLRGELANDTSRCFIVILSISDNNCVIRFHQLRMGETWLDNDLETYTEESVLVLSSGNCVACP